MARTAETYRASRKRIAKEQKWPWHLLRPMSIKIGKHVRLAHCKIALPF